MQHIAQNAIQASTSITTPALKSVEMQFHTFQIAIWNWGSSWTDAKMTAQSNRILPAM